MIATIQKDFKNKTIPFDSFAQRVTDSYENVFYFKNLDIRAALAGKEVTLENLKTLIGDIVITGKQFESVVDTITFGTRTGKGIIAVEALDGGDIVPGKPLDVRMIFIDQEPLRYRPALGTNGEVLNERYLINTVATPDPTTGQYVVNLIFNTE